MRHLILGAAALTLLPLLAASRLCLPDLPAPVHLFSKTGAVIMLESVRLV